MSNIPVGSIVFQVRRGNVYSDVIKTVTRSKFSHVLITLGEFHGREAILEAGAREVLINFLDAYEGEDDYFEIFTPDFSKKARLKNVDLCIKKYLQVEYSYWQAIGVGLVSLSRMIGFKISNPFRRGMICSELGHYYIQGLLNCTKIPDLDEPNNVSPEEVYQWVSSSLHFTRSLVKNFGP